MAINQQGEVLGYSFIFNAIERIGKWNRKGKFETLFTQGTPEVPTISNDLMWNEDELVVVSSDARSEHVPDSEAGRAREPAGPGG